MKKKRDKSEIPYSKIRRDWGGVKPFERLFHDAKKYNRHPKHKKDFLDGASDDTD